MRGVQRGGPVGTEQADAHFSHDTASHRAQLLAMMCDLSSIPYASIYAVRIPPPL